MRFGPTPSGATIEQDTKPADILLWRFMIDHRHQRHGIGRKVLDLIVAHPRTRAGAKRPVSSHVPGEGGPHGVHLRYGFTETGAVDEDGEVEIAIGLR